MKKNIVIALIYLCITSCNQQNSNKQESPDKHEVWNKDYEQQLYKNLDSTIKPAIPNKKGRDSLVFYVMKRLKSELPGGVESISSDSLHKLNEKIGKEYAYKMDVYNPGLTNARVKWTSEMEQTIRSEFLKQWGKRDLVLGNKLCDCVIEKLKQKSPDSIISPIPTETLVNIAKKCRHDLKID